VRTYIQGHYCASPRELEILKNPVNRKILETLKLKYPLGMTANDLKDAMKEPLPTIHAKLDELEKEYFIKKQAIKRRDKGVRPSSVYIIEEVSTLLQSQFPSQLAPGNVKFSNDIAKIWERIANKEDEERLYKEMTQYINKIIRLTKESSDEKIKRIAPDTSKEICCSNCGFNHEAREFIRSVLLHLIDRLEINVGFIRLMKDHELLTDDAYAQMMDLSNSLIIEERSKEVSKPAIIQERLPQEHPTPMGAPITIPLRILSIQKDTVSQSVPFLAIDKDVRFICGTLDRALVRDEMVSDTMVKCVTDDLEGDEEEGLYIGISINHSIELVKDDSSFPKVSQLTSKIKDIDTTRREYVLEAAILDGPYLDDTVSDQSTYWAPVGDETGLIHLVDDRFLPSLHKGDTIKIIGALPLTEGIQLGYYGVIEKIGELGYDSLEKLRKQTRIFPPNKVVTIERTQLASEAFLKVILHRMHLLNDFTRLFLTIENINENKEVTFYRKELRLFQGKKQFECLYHSDRYSRNVKDTIPAGIEETGVLLFEPLGNSQDPVRFHFKFRVEGFGYASFNFDGINLSKKRICQ
jgi:predicted ArsR family transcriptional regulator